MAIRTTFTSLLIMVVLFTGCSSRKLRLKRQRPEQSLLIALKDDDPDKRYSALAELSKSKSLGEDFAVKALIVIAKTDPNPLVRAIATHNLGKIADQRVAELIVSVMTDTDSRVRTEAAWGLSEISLPALKQSSHETKAKQTLQSALATDSDQDVRIHCAAALSKFKEKDVLYTLISALKDKDFAVRYQAKKSLILLTGKTFHTNAQDWLNWLKLYQNPFQLAGQTPAELTQPKHNVFQRTNDRFYQWYLNWQGPAK